MTALLQRVTIPSRRARPPWVMRMDEWMNRAGGRTIGARTNPKASAEIGRHYWAFTPLSCAAGCEFIGVCYVELVSWIFRKTSEGTEI